MFIWTRLHGLKTLLGLWDEHGVAQVGVAVVSSFGVHTGILEEDDATGEERKPVVPD